MRQIKIRFVKELGKKSIINEQRYFSVDRRVCYLEEIIMKATEMSLADMKKALLTFIYDKLFIEFHFLIVFNSRLRRPF